jgi:hypothetical protein
MAIAASIVTEQMVDELAQVRDQLKALTAREKFLKDKFRKEGAGIYRGRHYQVEISFTTRPQTDMDKVREELGVAWIAANSKTVEVMNIAQMEVVQ